MGISINAIETCMNIPECITAEEIQLAFTDDKFLGMLPNYVLHGQPTTKAEVQKEVQPFWSFRDKTLVRDGITLEEINNNNNNTPGMSTNQIE